MMSVPEAWQLPRMPGTSPSRQIASINSGGKASPSVGKIAPVEGHRRAGDFPVAGRRVLAARDFAGAP